MRRLFLTLCAAALLGAQKMPIVLPTFTGTLHIIDKKKIVLKDDKDHETDFRRTNKTEFLEGKKKVAPETLKAGDKLQIEAREDIDTSLIAVRVHLQK